LGWLASAYVIVLSVAALPLGVIGDLRSRRSVITWGVAVWSAATTAGGFVRRFWQLFICRALVGFGEAGYAPASQAIIAQYYKGRRRAFAIGVYSVGMAFGGVLGIWLGGVIAERYGWRWAFIWMGLPGLVLALLASRLRELDRRPPPPIVETLRQWWQHGMHGVTHYVMPLAICAGIGAALAGFFSLFEGIPSQFSTALFGIGTSVGIAWTVWRHSCSACTGSPSRRWAPSSAYGRSPAVCWGRSSAAAWRTGYSIVGTVDACSRRARGSCWAGRCAPLCSWCTISAGSARLSW